VFYKFIIEKGGLVLDTIDAMILTSDAITFTVTPGDVIGYFKYYEKLAYSCAFNNDTEYFNCVVADTSGLMTKVCLEIVKKGTLQDTTECTECSTSSSVTIGCHLGNRTGKTFAYTLYAYLDLGSSDTRIIDSGWIELVSVITEYELEGVFLAFLLVGTVAFIGFWNPPVAIILCLAALGLSRALELVMFQWGSMVGITIVGLIILWRLRD